MSANALLHVLANWGLAFRVNECFGIIQGYGGYQPFYPGLVCQTVKPVLGVSGLFSQLRYKEQAEGLIPQNLVYFFIFFLYESENPCKPKH